MAAKLSEGAADLKMSVGGEVTLFPDRQGTFKFGQSTIMGVWRIECQSLFDYVL
jgi:hypothetical protein